MADSPYAKYQQADEDQSQTDKPAAKAAPAASGDPYAKYQEQPVDDTSTQHKEEKPGAVSQLASKADDAITGALAPNPENTSSFMKTNTREVPKTLGREMYEGGKTALGMIPGAYHAFADEATPEEKEQNAQFEKENNEEPGAETSGLKRIGLGIQRISGLGSAAEAAKTYMNPKTRPTYEQALSVLPEAIGQGAGTVVGGEMLGKGIKKGIDVAKENAPAIKEAATAPVRAGAKAVNAVKNNPTAAGAIIGGAAGAKFGPVGVGMGAVEGAKGGGMVNRFLKRVPDLNENYGMRPTPEQANRVGNEYIPEEIKNAPKPEANANAKPRIEFGNPAEHVPAKEEPNLVGNEHAEGTMPEHETPVTPKGALGRIEYAEPTPAAAPREEGLVGNEHTEQQTPAAGEAKPKNPVSGVEYGEHQPSATTPDKEITKDMVKSTPGTSMSAEGKAKAQAADQVHVDKAKAELGEGAPAEKILDRAKTLKDEAAAEHTKSLGNKPAGNVPPEAKEVTRAANDYNEQVGKPPIKGEKVAVDPRAPDVADAYDKLKHDPTNPEVQKSYAALIKETMDQFHHLQAEGYKFDTSPEDPYQGEDASKQMLDDIHNNKHLSVWEGGAPPADHPLSAVDPETGKSYNSIFRFVHDVMGHGAGDNDFSQAGEENAYNRHAQSYSKEAIPALTTETKGQTSHYFNNEKVRNGGTHEFAEHKAALLPEEFYAKPESETAQVKGAAPEQVNAAEAERTAKAAAFKEMAGDKTNQTAPFKKYGDNIIEETKAQVEKAKEAAIPEDVLSHIESGKDHAVLTAENPNNGRISDEENATRNEALKKELIEKGYKPVDVTGHTKDVEGETEHSFFVPDIKPADAADLGRKYGQQAVLTSEGLHDLNKDVVNPVKQGEGLMTDETARKQPYYSRVGDVDFSVPIDFDKEVSPKNAIERIDSAVEKIRDLEKQVEAKFGSKAADDIGSMAEEEDMTHQEHIDALKSKLSEGKGESKVSPEDTTSVNNIVKDLGEQDIIKAGKKYDVDHEDYDFKKRDEGRHRVERDQYAKDLTTEIPDEMKQKLVAAEQAYDDADNSTFSDADRSSASKVTRAKAIWDKAHEPDFDMKEHMAGKTAAPEATAETAKMSDEELKKAGFTAEDIENGKHLPTVGGGAKAKATGTDIIPEEANKHLTDEERQGLKSDLGRRSFVDKLKALPKVQEFVDAAIKGQGGRKWYQRSAAAFDALSEEAPRYFQEGDRGKFTDFLASLSPQQTVTMNLKEALNAWTKYVDAGRPTGNKLRTLLYQNTTLPDAKVPNAMKALAGEEMWPDVQKSAAFKVPSFARNLNNYLNYVTNDGWQALFGGLKASEISRPTSYHPLSVMTRAAADALGWEPAEAQAAIWAFTKAFQEHGETDPAVIRSMSQDFADIMAHDPEVREMLGKLGVNHGQLDTKLAAIGEKPAITERTTPTTENSVRKLSTRIKQAGREIPAPKDQRSLDYTAQKGDVEDEDTSFEPEKLEDENNAFDIKEKDNHRALGKLYDRSSVLLSPEGRLSTIDEYNPRGESQHAELLRTSGYKGDLTKFLKEGGVRAYTVSPDEAGVEIQNDSPETIQRALRVVDGLGREKTRFEIADPKTFKTTFSEMGTYHQIKNALDKRK